MAHIIYFRLFYMSRKSMKMNLPRLDLQLSIESGSWDTDFRLRVLCEKILSEAISFLSSKGEKSFLDLIEISIVFTDSNRIKMLNFEYRGINESTNVLSFPSFFALSNQFIGPMLGDIILAYEVIKDEVNVFGKKFEDHLAHLIVHGFLHLVGYDHIDDKEALTMEELERSILANLGISDPYIGMDLIVK